MSLSTEVEEIISLIFNIKNKVVYSRHVPPMFEDLITRVDRLLRYEEEDKPWCEYHEDGDYFLVEWEDRKYRLKRPKTGETNGY